MERTQWEFRGFVSEGKLTAISQYFSVCYFEELSRNQEAIREKIVNYHESIKERIQPHLKSYGIDFFIASDGRVITIELNPFYTRSVLNDCAFQFFGCSACKSCFSLGAGLFDWKVRESARESPCTFTMLNDVQSKCVVLHSLRCTQLTLLQADGQLLTNGNGNGTTVIRVLQEKDGVKHGAYEWMPLRWASLMH